MLDNALPNAYFANGNYIQLYHTMINKAILASVCTCSLLVGCKHSAPSLPGIAGTGSAVSQARELAPASVAGKTIALYAADSGTPYKSFTWHASNECTDVHAAARNTYRYARQSGVDAVIHQSVSGALKLNSTISLHFTSANGGTFSENLAAGSVSWGSLGSGTFRLK